MDENSITPQQALSKAAQICSKSEKCSYEIRNKLMDWGIEKYDAEGLVDKLKEEGYIDDERYVKAYAQEKFRINKWGKTKIAYYLKQKRLPGHVIDIGLDEIDDSKYVALLKKTMKDKAKTTKSSNRFDKMGKIIRFTQNRGFEPQLIHKYLNEIIS